MRPLIIDSFAGGGGASTGIERALGRSPDIAINHNEAALALHAANHPDTLHLSENIWKIDPLDYVKGEHVGLAWFSPDCKHFSKAKGGKPVERNIRDLAWVVVLWAQRAKPDVIMLENVEEFRFWGPLIETEKGLMPDPAQKGATFNKWKKELARCGYKMEWRELRACDYGAPTIRKRFFMVVRCDKLPIVWPEATHGAPDDADVIAGRKKPWRTAAEIIDWSQPCPSIFDTSEEIKAKHNRRAIRPLAKNTLARIARGMKRYVLDAQRPFNTITGANRGEKALVTAYLAQHNTMPGDGIHAGRPVDAPLSTLTARGTQQNIVTPYLTEYYGNGEAHREDEPCHTMTTRDRFTHVECGLTVPPLSQEQIDKAHKVADFMRQYGEWVGGDFVTFEAEGAAYIIWDIGMRMLTPREQFNAQGFPPDYEIEMTLNGKPIPLGVQTSCCGNSCSPDVVEALVAANCGHLREELEAAK